MISVHIVDDHKMVVEGISRMLNELNDIRVTASYYDLESCKEGLPNLVPDVLLLDIGLPDGDGVEFCKSITKQYPGLKVIMLTTYKEFSIAKRALHNGAVGYLLKNAEIAEMVAGIRMVYEGEQFLCEEIDVLLTEKKNEGIAWLSNRESQVLKLISEGYTSKEIGKRIFIDEETVRTYRKNLLVKLNARNTPELVKLAYEKRMVF